MKVGAVCLWVVSFLGVITVLWGLAESSKASPPPIAYFVLLFYGLITAGAAIGGALLWRASTPAKEAVPHLHR